MINCCFAHLLGWFARNAQNLYGFILTHSLSTAGGLFCSLSTKTRSRRLLLQTCGRLDISTFLIFSVSIIQMLQCSHCANGQVPDATFSKSQKYDVVSVMNVVDRCHEPAQVSQRWHTGHGAGARIDAATDVTGRCATCEVLGTGERHVFVLLSV